MLLTRIVPDMWALPATSLSRMYCAPGTLRLACLVVLTILCAEAADSSKTLAAVSATPAALNRTRAAWESPRGFLSFGQRLRPGFSEAMVTPRPGTESSSPKLLRSPFLTDSEYKRFQTYSLAAQSPVNQPPERRRELVDSYDTGMFWEYEYTGNADCVGNPTFQVSYSLNTCLQDPEYKDTYFKVQCDGTAFTAMYYESWDCGGQPYYLSEKKTGECDDQHFQASDSDYSGVDDGRYHYYYCCQGSSCAGQANPPSPSPPPNTRDYSAGNVYSYYYSDETCETQSGGFLSFALNTCEYRDGFYVRLMCDGHTVTETHYTDSSCQNAVDRETAPLVSCRESATADYADYAGPTYELIVCCSSVGCLASLPPPSPPPSPPPPPSPFTPPPSPPPPPSPSPPTPPPPSPFPPPYSPPPDLTTSESSNSPGMVRSAEVFNFACFVCALLTVVAAN